MFTPHNTHIFSSVQVRKCSILNIVSNRTSCRLVNLTPSKKKNPHAAALGRLGGPARAKALSSQRRREIARLGGKARQRALAAKSKPA